MNHCVLMAEIIRSPQLRYTPDTQIPVTEMLVQFAGLRAEDPPATLKVVAWRNLAQEVQERYQEGDQVILEGRLGMNTVQLEGFKEKRAEMTLQRIHPVSVANPPAAAAVPSTRQEATLGPGMGNAPEPYPAARPPRQAPAAQDYTAPSVMASPASGMPSYAGPIDEPSDDDIPF
ncbi:single-stranded DNA-binding protein [Trichothermofontia sichuanensis B231]|uniref:single-stranded DNA-binding protein n=1 Tax=Trichothermofontia sichuanensis TaxID=3045816 RepID=UPI0022455085|nr:single-stranded DNA-binding protein [Trichothermofontia sichuanensis]UZQ54963.1 single-stranded DNA-binding protein [Trichothermofontia sichuanensis B231]